MLSLRRFGLPLLALPLSATLLASACGGGASSASPAPEPAAPAPWVWTLPAGFAPPAVPADNPMNVAKVELGRHLFYDARLSGQRHAGLLRLPRAGPRVHRQPRAGARRHRPEPPAQHADAHQRGLSGHARLGQPGVAQAGAANAHAVFNTTPIEMGVNDANREQVLQRLKDDAQYPARFAAAFHGEPAPLHWDNVIKAIAAFERTLISAGSRYDQAPAGQITLSAQEQRGQQLFFGPKALCASCHGGPNLGGALASAGGSIGTPAFHNIGLFNIGGTGAYPEPNRGLFELTGAAADMGQFRAPSLRNAELTAPYFHAGSAPTLEAAVQVHVQHGREVGNGLYAGDGRANPFKDPLIDRIDLSEADQADLVAFLTTLTDASVASHPRFANPFAP